MIPIRRCPHTDCKHYDGLHEIWADRLGVDAVRNPIIAELRAHCERCSTSFLFELRAHSDRWYIDDRRIGRVDGGWIHRPPGPPCWGQLTITGSIPAGAPRRIVQSSDRWAS